MREIGFCPHPHKMKIDTKQNPNNKNFLFAMINSLKDKKPLNNGNDLAYKGHF